MEGVVRYTLHLFCISTITQVCVSHFNFIVLYNIAAFPFVKNPEDNPTYSVHFSKQWHDTMLVSLHNFLATIFQVGKRTPSLCIYEFKVNITIKY